MKYKWIAAATVGVLCAAALLLANADDGLLVRTWQHKQDFHADSASLPVISIETQNQAMPILYGTLLSNGKNKTESSCVSAQVTVTDSAQTGAAPPISYSAQISFRGHSSIYFDKHPYKINFVDAQGGEDKTVSLLGMEPHDEWALYAPYQDRSLLRNYLCLNTAGEIMEFTPDVRYCELYVNGVYEGLYVAMETVAKAPGRVDLETYHENDVNLEYILQLDWYTETGAELNNFLQYAKRYPIDSVLSVVYPGKDKLNEDAKSKIENQMSRFEKALYSFDYKDAQLGYPAYIDTASFVDYFIINEFFQNSDAGSRSTYFYKNSKEKLKVGPVWDFNAAMNNNIVSLPIESFVMVNKPYYYMLMKDKRFVQRVIDRYHSLRKTALSDAQLLQSIDDTIVYLGPAIERNNARWQTVFSLQTMQNNIRLLPEERNPRNYDEAVAQLKQFIINRGAYLDEHIETLYQYCHPSVTKKYNS